MVTLTARLGIHKHTILSVIFLVLHGFLGTLERTTIRLGTEGTLLRRLLGVATRPSPLAASHTARELATASVALLHRLAAHLNGKITSIRIYVKFKIRRCGWQCERDVCYNKLQECPNGQLYFVAHDILSTNINIQIKQIKYIR